MFMIFAEIKFNVNLVTSRCQVFAAKYDNCVLLLALQGLGINPLSLACQVWIIAFVYYNEKVFPFCQEFDVVGLIIILNMSV